MSCPICGHTNYQAVIEEFPSAIRKECGVCHTTYGVVKLKFTDEAIQASADVEAQQEKERKLFVGEDE